MSASLVRHVLFRLPVDGLSEGLACYITRVRAFSALVDQTVVGKSVGAAVS